MITVEDVFQRHFPGLTPAEVDAELGAVPTAGADPLNAGAQAYLAAEGGSEVAATLSDFDSQATHRDRKIAAARSLSESMRHSVGIEEAARLMHVSRSRISHRLGAGSLYAFTIQHRRRIPRWQITEDGSPLPGLGEIVAAIPAGVHPLTLHSFMTQ